MQQLQTHIEGTQSADTQIKPLQPFPIPLSHSHANDSSFTSEHMATPDSSICSSSLIWMKMIEKDVKAQTENCLNQSINLNSNSEFTNALPQIPSITNISNISPLSHTQNTANKALQSHFVNPQSINGINPFSLAPMVSTPVYSVPNNNGFNFPSHTSQTYPLQNNVLQNNSLQNNDFVLQNNALQNNALQNNALQNNALQNSANQSQSNNANNANNATINNSNVCMRTITVKFLTVYYNALHSKPTKLKRFYHSTNTQNNNFHKISALDTVLFVDIDKIVHQKSVKDSILIRVNGTMKFEKNMQKQFEHIFLIDKSLGFWLIENDMFWLIESKSNSKTAKLQNNDTEKIIISSNNNILKPIPNNSNNNILKPIPNPKSYSRITRTQQSQSKGNNANLQSSTQNQTNQSNANANECANIVNKRMVNKFYHDTSYQTFDNALAVFIRPIPNNITHSKLCGVLRTNLLKQCAVNGMDACGICIDYIDVNYHKQFAFVYFGNEQTLNTALQMNEISIDGNQCQIQKKRSHNGPRRFISRKRNENNAAEWFY